MGLFSAWLFPGTEINRDTSANGIENLSVDGANSLAELSAGDIVAGGITITSVDNASFLEITDGQPGTYQGVYVNAVTANGDPVQYFFPDDQGLINETTIVRTGNFQPCFCRDTLIDTDQGPVAVQDLEVGMMVRTKDNGMQPIRWIGVTAVASRAVRIKAGAMGNTRDLLVSPRHRMLLDGWQIDMLFDHDHALVTALELVNDDTIVREALTDVEYFHIMFDQHEVIFAEGAATESFHPDQASMGSMDKAAREEIFTLFPELAAGIKREQVAPSLSATQASYVSENLDSFLN